MTSIIPFPRAGQTPPDVGFLAYLMERTEPELHAPALDGESGEERAARLATAADIAEELATEYRATTPEPDPARDHLDELIAGGGDPFFETEGRAA